MVVLNCGTSLLYLDLDSLCEKSLVLKLPLKVSRFAAVISDWEYCLPAAYEYNKAMHSEADCSIKAFPSLSVCDCTVLLSSINNQSKQECLYKLSVQVAIGATITNWRIINAIILLVDSIFMIRFLSIINCVLSSFWKFRYVTW